MNFPIAISSVEKEGVFRASKWLKHAFLLNREEINSLFSAISPFFLIPATGLFSKNSWEVSFEQFLEKYEIYLEWMLSNPDMPPLEIRRFFSLMITSSLDCVYAVEVAGEKVAIKPKLPVIQMQLFHCFFSQFDHEIRSMVTSPESFGWGIQLAYPQVYENPKNHEFSKVLLEDGFPNSKPFKEIVSWLRKNTQPVVLRQNEGRVCAPFRIGKNSLEKRDSHVGLQKILLNGVKISGS